VPCPSPTPKVGISIEEMTDPEFLALQRLANEALLYGQRPNTPPSNIGVGNVSISESSPYPWDVYGYNDSKPYERRYMWTPEKLRRDGAVNSDADRYTLYNRWLSLQQPQHNINGKVTLYDQDGRLIKPNDPIIVGTLATGVISLTNNQQDDPIAYIAYDVKLYRYNATREELEEMYSFSDDHVEARLLPGQTWTKQIARNIPLQPGRWIGVIKVYNQIDGIMLCEIRTGEYDVGIDHGGGIISFG
jgi:hypothetical protein